MRITVVIPAHDAAETVGRTLQALAEQDLDNGNYEVVMVDDGSQDETVALAEGAQGHVSVIRQEELGAAAARNRGAAASNAPALAFTDSDCFPRPGWLRAGLEALEAADLVQGAVSADPTVSRGPFDRTLWVKGEVGLYESANLFVRRDLFERVGGFEQWLRPAGRPFAEDLWFGWRARRAGARTAFCAAAEVHHAVFPRGANEYVRERWRYTFFPDVAARVPEIRDRLFFARFFLNRRTAAFDLAALGLGTAIASASRLPLRLTVPYAVSLSRQSLRWRKRAPQVAAVNLLADLVSAAALLRGSVRRRNLVV